MAEKNLRCNIEDGIAHIIIQRPKVLNALNRETLVELDELLIQLGTDEKVRVLLVRGEGEKAFVAGADIKELAENSALSSNLHAKFGQSVMDRLENLGKPSIAAINGYALGGGLELALACTLRIASSNAKLGLPEITLGIIPGFGGTQRLSRVIGRGRAMHMILSGRPVSADDALAFGIVSELAAPEELDARALDLAHTLAGYSAVTLRLAEETVRRGLEMNLTDGLAYEASQFGLAAASDDYQEGMQAFLGKRAPAFKHR
ncbi:MAG TPA: enoyl-CoA hydratase-related protein [Candidatus Krumholzibacteria bacterium]|jgi:enoyl-CoA hydratase